MSSTVSCSVTTQDWTEAERLAELARLDLGASGMQGSYDDLTRIAALACAAPIALVSLVEEQRQWFKARVGLDLSETPRSMSVCAHAIETDGLLVIGDLTQDPRTRDNPLVTGERSLRFYAGAVIRARSGIPLGTLCVLDPVARPEGLTPV